MGKKKQTAFWLPEQEKGRGDIPVNRAARRSYKKQTGIYRKAILVPYRKEKN